MSRDELAAVSRHREKPHWKPRRVIPMISIRLLQKGLGTVFFASGLSALGKHAASRLALCYGRQFKSASIRKDGELTVVTGLPKRAYPRGGICVGDVFLTGPQPRPSVLRHEAQHARQWRIYGLAMPVLYWLAGSDPHRNWFEVEAGLSDGGYL